MSLVNEYFLLQESYEFKYGEKTVILMQVGSFYEAYAYDVHGKASQVASLCNMILTAKNKKDLISRSNPNMCGMPLQSLQRYVGVLCKNGYTVVVVDQCDEPTTRRVSHVYSPGTFVDEASDETCVISSVYMDKMSIAVCWIDISTGKVAFQEVHHPSEAYRNEEMIRLIEMSGCKETVYTKKGECGRGLPFRAHHIPFSPTYETSMYQNMHFEKAFRTETSPLSAIEQIDMAFYHVARIALVILIEWCQDHHPSLVHRIRHPVLAHTDTLVLHHTSMYQLQLLHHEMGLFDIIDKTKTPMGQRLLKDTLLNPHTCARTLRRAYADIELVTPHKDDIVHDLKHICDMDKITRKIANMTMCAQDVRQLITCMSYAVRVSEREPRVSFHVPTTFIEKYHTEWSKIIHMDDVSVMFNEGVYPDVDDARREFDTHLTYLNDIAKKYSRTIDKDDAVKVECVKDTYAVVTTHARAKVLKSRVGASVHFNAESKQRVTISTDTINTTIHHVLQSKQKYDACVETRFRAFVAGIYDDYDAMCTISQYIASMDVVTSHATTAAMYDYVAPTVVENDVSYVKATNVRHPIVERLDQDTMYTGNDVDFSQKKGMLLYGVNGSGKSCFSKSIGVCVIMAQMGMYVPASTFTFCPYERLFTRISSDDNMYKGHSSFYVEMVELHSILTCANHRSLIIGDEICKGTEHISAISIVAAICNMMTKLTSTFVFATHLHGLVALAPVQSVLEHIHVKHIGVTIEGGTVVFERTIRDGQGEHLYGLEIATHILCNDTFSALALDTRNALLDKKIPKVSTYNKRVTKTACQVCASTKQLDTHHIHFQCDAHDNIKHAKGNLVVLCHACHENVHASRIRIHGWKSTSKGSTLSWT